MNNTMGQIIKRLRKENGFTQEELAEQLGVTFQAVSKWENDTGLPDISQIVPLATVFGVSTDVLFGVYGTDHAEDVLKLIYNARALITSPATKASVRLCYDALLDGLKKYPNNITLLSGCLETGLSLAHPENDIYDSENGKKIYMECIRQANLVIKYGKNAGDILRAHMIMVILHSAYGNIEAAREHADKFPVRSDMTVHNMYAYIAHSDNDYRSESIYRQYDFLYHLESMLNSVVELGCCYYDLGYCDDAREVFGYALKLIDLVCEKEDIRPTLHIRERGDIYALLAEVYLKEGNTEEALHMLKKMVDHDLHARSEYKSKMKMNTPLLRDTDNVYYHTDSDIKQSLILKLDSTAFDKIRANKDFLKLIKMTAEF